MKKLLVSILFVIAVFSLALVTKVYAIENTIADVSVTEDGNVSWSVYPGAVKYQLKVGDAGNGLISSECDSLEGISTITGAGTYTFTITAYSDEEGTNKLAGYTGKFKYDGTSKYTKLHKITFDTNGGSNIEPQYLENNATITKPENPKKDGNTFISWYFDSDLEYEYYFGMPVNSDKVLYAKFVSNDKLIKTLNFTMVLPNIGDEVKEVETDGGYTIQDKRPELTTDNSNVNIEGYYQDITKEKNDFGEYPLFYGTFETDGEYGILLDFYVKEGIEAYLDQNIKVYLNGKEAEVGEFFSSNFRNATAIIKLVTKKEYKILDGADSTYIVGSGENLVVRADGEQEDFQGAKMDEEDIPEDALVTAVGSTILTIKSDYLDNLALGVHKLTFVYPDGEVSTNITIAKEDAKTDAEEEPVAEENQEEIVEENAQEEVKQTTSKTKKGNPGTGDNIYVWVTLAVSSAILFVLIKKLNK